MKKVHTSALCIIPPKHVWHDIQIIRRDHDKGFVRWMPHINVMYPFYGDENGQVFEKCAFMAHQSLRDVHPVSCSLRKFNYFHHKKFCTLWLEPDCCEKLQEIQSALLCVFPECTDLCSDPKRKINAFTPHLTVGQWPDQNAIEDAMKTFDWETLSWVVEDVGIISRAGKEDPFIIRWRIPLAGRGCPQEINEMYVSNEWHST